MTLLPELLQLIYEPLDTLALQHCSLVCRQWNLEAKTAFRERQTQIIVAYAREKLHDSLKKSGLNLQNTKIHFTAELHPQGRVVELVAPNTKPTKLCALEPKFQLLYTCYPYCREDGQVWLPQTEDQPIAFRVHLLTDGAPESVQDVSQRALTCLNALAQGARKLARSQNVNWFCKIFSDTTNYLTHDLVRGS